MHIQHPQPGNFEYFLREPPIEAKDQHEVRLISSQHGSERPCGAREEQIHAGRKIRNYGVQGF